jgi:hypothetical protein
MNPLDTTVRPHPGAIPTSEIVWPSPQHTVNKIQQTKTSAIPQSANVLKTVQPAAASVPPRTTPAPVSNVRVVTRPAVNGSKNIIVQFQHPHGDPHFQGATVYLKKANGQPTIVASGAKSPLTFTAPVSDAAHAVFVSSDGNWGSTNVLTSPSRRVSLK